MADSLPNSSARRELRFQTFDQAIAEVDRLFAHGYERKGNWDLAQMCDHLATTFEGSVRGFGFGMPRVLQAMFGQFGLRYVLKNQRTPFRARVPKQLEPASGLDPAVAIVRLKHSIGEFESYTGEVARHPFFGKMTREQWRGIHLFHCAHHLAFLHPSPLPAA
jgi:hypothetical protein